MNETAQLAKFTAEMTYDKLPSQAVAVAKQCILDWLGVAIRGAHEEPAKILRSVALKMCGTGDATVFDGGSRRIDAYNAAMVNGAASHTLDFDDLHNASIIHLATVVVPAAMAVAEAEHKSGKALLSAVCAGYEAGARAGEAIIPESYFYWHTTGTAGIFGSAAAAASLLGLTAEQSNMCLGSAGTQAAGLWEFLKEGAMSKALHSAKAASAGVFSAYLAQNGFTAASAILEGEKGFCPALSEAPRLEKITENLTYDDLKIQHNSFKPYACCKHAHAAIYGAQVLRGKYGITPDIIEGVELKVNNITDFLINNPAPQNVYGCKFSIQYCVAAALLYGRVGIDEFSVQVRESKAMQQLMANVVNVLRKIMLNSPSSGKSLSHALLNVANVHTVCPFLSSSREREYAAVFSPPRIAEAFSIEPFSESPSGFGGNGDCESCPDISKLPSLRSSRSLSSINLCSFPEVREFFMPPK